ncbi:hypothetical protein, partial [uncultured Bacteroides sp.]|uniref:hypothetical protein n=1 Tax=uncultured Bacteroides sp. TaxID=162156 RepID=UPI0034447E58
RLYYILFVYLKSFKELNFRLEAKVITKVKDLFITDKLFRIFFSKKVFLAENLNFLSRSLATTR